MKKLIASWLVILALLVGIFTFGRRATKQERVVAPVGLTSHETLGAQQARLEPILWQNLTQFGLDHIFFKLEVKHATEMECGACWGDTTFQKYGVLVEILDINDYPESMPESERVTFQKQVVQHEVLHVMLTRLGVPPEVQDRLIEGMIAPGIRQTVVQH